MTTQAQALKILNDSRKGIVKTATAKKGFKKSVKAVTKRKKKPKRRRKNRIKKR